MKKLFCFALLVLCLAASKAGAQVTVIKAGRLVDPETGSAARDQLIVVEAGKVTAFGSDVLLTRREKGHGAFALDFLENYVRVGMRPAEILRMMTADAARLVGVEKQRGRVAPGLAADIIATPADPLADVYALRQVSFVMKDGKVFRHAR